MASTLAAWRTLDDSRDRAEFYRMWRAGYAAAFTHPKSFETMGPREAPTVEAVRQWLLEGTRRGRDVAELVTAGGGRFEDFERALIPLGEESGNLDNILRILADFYMKKHKLMLWVKKKMAYSMLLAANSRVCTHGGGSASTPDVPAMAARMASCTRFGEVS